MLNQGNVEIALKIFIVLSFVVKAGDWTEGVGSGQVLYALLMSATKIELAFRHSLVLANAKK